MIEAQIATSVNVDKLNQAVDSMGLDASFSAFDNSLNSIRLKVASGNFDIVKQEIESIKTDVINATESAAKVADANKVVGESSKLNFWWAEKPDMNASSAKLAEAKGYLAKGDFVLAADAAQLAVNMSANEREAFWRKVKSNWVLGGFLSIAKVFSDPEKYESKSVKRPQFEWKAMPDLIQIDFSKPIAEVSDIVIEDPGAPVMPAFQPSASAIPITIPQKKPIQFKLDPGNPTSCGLTCRQTMANLTNIGDDTAHNVKVNLNIYNKAGDNVYQKQELIGDIAGGQSISKSEIIEVDCGFLFSKCIDKQFILKAEVTFDEGTQIFPDKQFSG